LSKKIQILTILYPYGVKAVDVCEVYETVLTKIQQLIDGVEIGYTPAEDVAQSVETVTDGMNLSDIAYTSETTEPAEDVATVSDVPEEYTDSIAEWANRKYNSGFVEDVKRVVDDSWKETTFMKCTFFKNGDNFVIKGDSSRLDTNWDYLCNFFESLHDETVIKTIPGLNTKKRNALSKFYEAHPNFSCHVEKINGFNAIVKDDVRVNPATNSTYESGSVHSDAYSE